MKVLHVIPSVSAIHGGPSFAVKLMTRALANTGISVDVATTDDNGKRCLSVPLGQPLKLAEVTYWYFHRQTSFYKFSWPLTVWLAKHIVDYDLLHIHALFSYAALPASWLAARVGVPYILRPLGTLNRWGMQHRRRRLKQLSFPLIERAIINRASLLHYTSENERDEARALGVERPHAIIPLGVELEAIPHARSQAWLAQRAPQLAGRRIVLFLSRIDPIKGLELLLQAFAQVRATGAEVGLLIAGHGEPAYVLNLQRLAVGLGIADDVYWAGFVSGVDKQGALAAADVFALPSYSENFGVAVVEAMAAGLPVVISDQVGINNEVVDAGAGSAVPCEVNQITTALLHVIDDPSARIMMGERGRKLVSERYSIAGTTKMLLEAYSGIANPSAERSQTLKDTASDER